MWYASSRHGFIMMAIERLCVLRVHRFLILWANQANCYSGLKYSIFQPSAPQLNEKSSLGLLDHAGNPREYVDERRFDIVNYEPR